MTNRVLIVDDAVTIRLFLRGVLEDLGCVVEEAWNGAEALERALCAKPDLLLVDVNMPHLDGYGLLRAVRQNPDLADIPAIMISTETAEQDAAQAYAVGANLYLCKPPQPDRLAALVRVLTGTAAA